MSTHRNSCWPFERRAAGIQTTSGPRAQDRRLPAHRTTPSNRTPSNRSGHAASRILGQPDLNPLFNLNGCSPAPQDTITIMSARAASCAAPARAREVVPPFPRALGPGVLIGHHPFKLRFMSRQCPRSCTMQLPGHPFEAWQFIARSSNTLCRIQ
jgi:hypothetical protein